MPETQARKRAAKDKREGKSATTQAGEFVHEEIEHVREGKHGARSARQAIAIGLSKAKRAGVDVPAPKKATKAARSKAAHDTEAGEHPRKPARKRSQAVSKALRREGTAAASKTALSRQARKAAAKRSAADRSAAAKKAARTKGPAERSTAAKKAARTRAKHSNSHAHAAH